MGKKKVLVEAPQSLVLRPVQPVTDNQQKTFQAYRDGKNLLLSGDAGTGKTFISLYLALRQILKKEPDYQQIIIIRSIVPSREIGYLPGSLKEKIGIYEDPYRIICNDLLQRGDGYEVLKSKLQVSFQTTSYLRGLTFENSIVLIDEIQNLSFGELSTVVTRIGENCRLIFCGDTKQSDLWRPEEREGIHHFLQIAKKMPSVESIEFDVNDIVRSSFVKEFLMAEHDYRKEHRRQSSGK
jgi:phosphate starvation-inducible protein PhoH